MCLELVIKKIHLQQGFKTRPEKTDFHNLDCSVCLQDPLHWTRKGEKKGGKDQMLSFKLRVKCEPAMPSVLVMVATLLLSHWTSQSLAADLCQCGLQRHNTSSIAIGTRVIGGKEAEEGEFPWAALILVKHYNKKKYITQRCAGSILNDR